MRFFTNKLTRAEYSDNLIFWYRNSDQNLEVDFEVKGGEKITIRYFRLQAAEWLFNQHKLPRAVILDEDSDLRTAIHLVTSLTATGIPVVLHSTKFSLSARRKATSWGMDDYVVGAVGEHLWEHVKTIGAVKQYTCELRRQSNPFADREPELPAFQRYWLKRSVDIIGASLLILLLLPLLSIIALLVKLESKGPVIYMSKRAGAAYRIFDFYKFRSMRINADKELSQLRDRNQYRSQQNDNAVFVKIKKDPRVTRVGRILRKTSLDELPQLFNVLFGDMSLVGNRPLPLYEAAALTTDRAAWRFLAPAGMTGLWQVSKRGKSEMSVSERIELDVNYAKNYSPWNDMQILARTFTAMIQEETV